MFNPLVSYGASMYSLSKKQNKNIKLVFPLSPFVPLTPLSWLRPIPVGLL